MNAQERGHFCTHERPQGAHPLSLVKTGFRAKMPAPPGRT
jgi:hypothetical protein